MNTYQQHYYSHTQCEDLHVCCLIISMIRLSRPAPSMHPIRSFQVHGIALPLLLYHISSTFWINKSFAGHSLRALSTSKRFLRSRSAKLSHSTEVWKAIALAILWLPNPSHCCLTIKSFQVGSTAGVGVSRSNNIAQTACIDIMLYFQYETLIACVLVTNMKYLIWQIAKKMDCLGEV